MPRKPIVKYVTDRIQDSPRKGTPRPKPVKFIGAARQDLNALPIEVRKEAGYALDSIQNGKDPGLSVKPMKTIGPSGLELIVDTKDGWFRVFYVVKFEEALYVLHSFQKKSNQTSKADIEKGTKRYQAMLQLRKDL